MDNQIIPVDLDGQRFLESRQVAKMIGKKHLHLMRDIRRYINDLEPNPNLDWAKFFIPSSYFDQNQQQRPCYLISKMGCEFIANKLTGKKGNQFTAQYVSVFNTMKQEINSPQAVLHYLQDQWNIPKTYGSALQLAANQQKQLDKQRPKVEYFDKMMRNQGLETATEIAKLYGWSARHLNQELKKRHIIFRRGGIWVPYQKYADKGYTQYEAYPFDSQKTQTTNFRNNLKWTQRGQKFIYDLLKKDGIVPVLERKALEE